MTRYKVSVKEKDDNDPYQDAIDFVSNIEEIPREELIVIHSQFSDRKNEYNFKPPEEATYIVELEHDDNFGDSLNI